MGNMLKPALARGDLQLMGATTLDEYRIIEKDGALARRFQSVYVEEPNVEDTISVLRGLKTNLELHHAGIRIKDEALVAAATLSDRYYTDRFQPDKSIDLVGKSGLSDISIPRCKIKDLMFILLSYKYTDEACARLRLEQESKPEILWKLERDLMTKQIELSALEQEDDQASKQRRDVVQQEVDDLKVKVEKIAKIWQDERGGLTRIKDVKEELASAKREVDMAKGRGDFAKAGELMHATIPRLEQELHDLEELEDPSKRKKKRLLTDAVDADAIATIVARHTGIPVSKISGSESRKLIKMEERLRDRVVGQDHALEAVSNCVRMARTGLQDRNKTLGNLLFLGPSGVGKTGE